MKTITTIEPLGTLLIKGIKKYEVRQWPFNADEPLAIHVGKNLEPLKKFLAENKNNILAKNLKDTTLEDFKQRAGKVLAVCHVNSCNKITKVTKDAVYLEDGKQITGLELKLGNYKVGLYAWEISDVKILNKPQEAKGQLGLWECPLENEERIIAALNSSGKYRYFKFLTSGGYAHLQKYPCNTNLKEIQKDLMCWWDNIPNYDKGKPRAVELTQNEYKEGVQA